MTEREAQAHNLLLTSKNRRSTIVSVLVTQSCYSSDREL